MLPLLKMEFCGVQNQIWQWKFLVITMLTICMAAKYVISQVPQDVHDAKLCNTG